MEEEDAAGEAPITPRVTLREPVSRLDELLANCFQLPFDVLHKYMFGPRLVLESLVLEKNGLVFEKIHTKQIHK